MILSEPPRLEFGPASRLRVTHYLFRFPAKFHPPVARTLVERFTSPGQTVLDPFCGSGTLGLEALLAGRSSISSDVDPVAALVTRVKTQVLDPRRLEHLRCSLLGAAEDVRRSDSELAELQFTDIGAPDLESQLAAEQLWVPQLPNQGHWFRNYVVLDLARLRAAISEIDTTSKYRDFVNVLFGSIIRPASNADPVPVSGLEVTSHMRRLDESGRIIDVHRLFVRALDRAIAAFAELRCLVPDGVKARSFRADATRLSRSMIRGTVHAVITSPPYHNAVDYYRRHTLEMYWMGLVDSHDERLELLQGYLGRPKVPYSHPFARRDAELSPRSAVWERRIAVESEQRSAAFRHYITGMTRALRRLADLLPPEAPIVFVVGNSRWGDDEIPTAELLAEAAGGGFKLAEYLSYPVKNRYMSYSRRNGASIDREFVIVLRRV